MRIRFSKTTPFALGANSLRHRNSVKQQIKPTNNCTLVPNDEQKLSWVRSSICETIKIGELNETGETRDLVSLVDLVNLDGIFIPLFANSDYKVQKITTLIVGQVVLYII